MSTKYNVKTINLLDLKKSYSYPFFLFFVFNYHVSNFMNDTICKVENKD